MVVAEEGFLLAPVLALHLAGAGQWGPQLGAAQHQALLRHHTIGRQAHKTQFAAKSADFFVLECNQANEPNGTVSGGFNVYQI